MCMCVCVCIYDYLCVCMSISITLILPEHETSHCRILHFMFSSNSSVERTVIERNPFNMAQPELTACNDFTLLLRGACLALRYLVLPYLTFPCHVLSCPAFPLIPLPLPTSFYLPFFSLPAFPLIPLPLPTSFYLPFLSLPAFPLRTSPYLFLPAFPLVTCLPSHYLTSPYLSLPHSCFQCFLLYRIKTISRYQVRPMLSRGFPECTL